MIAIQRRAVVDEYRQFSFQRNSVAFGSNGRLYYPHQARFESVGGRTGVLVEEGTTNLLGASGILDTDSNADGIADGWSAYATGTATGTWTMDATQATFGWALCQRIERTGGASADRFGISIGSSTSGAATPNTVSYLVKVASLDPGARVRLAVSYYNASGQYLEGRGVDLTSVQDWAWVSLPPSTDVNVARVGPFYVWIDGGNGVVYVQAVQAENKAYRTSFTNGTRAAETLTVPTAGVLYPQEGTIEFWAYVDAQVRDTSRVRRFFWHSTGGNSNRISIQHNNTPYWFFNIADANGNPHSLSVPDSQTPDGWHYFAMVWSGSRFAAFIDGVKQGELLNPTYLPQSVAETFNIGHSSGGYQANTLLYNLRISRRARTDQEIADAYAAGTLTADADTTLLLPFTGPDAQRSARVLYVPAVGF